MRFIMNMVLLRPSLPGTKCVNVWTNIRTGGSGLKRIGSGCSVCLAAVSIATLISGGRCLEQIDSCRQWEHNENGNVTKERKRRPMDVSRDPGAVA